MHEQGNAIGLWGDVFSYTLVRIIKWSEIKPTSSFPFQQPLGIDWWGVEDKDFTRGKICSGQAVSGSGSPEWPAVCVCDLGAPNSAGEELVTQNNKALPLQASRQWPPLKVKGSTSYTCQGCDLSPPQRLTLFFHPLLSCLLTSSLTPLIPLHTPHLSPPHTT